MEKLFLIICFLSSGVLLTDSEICKTIRTRILNEGDRFEPRRCFFCECRNQTLNCNDEEPDECPEPPCDPTVQIFTPDRCCKICPGVGTRCRFNGMSVEDGERFQLDPCGSCECNNGKLTCSVFYLNGHQHSSRWYKATMNSGPYNCMANLLLHGQKPAVLGPEPSC